LPGSSGHVPGAPSLARDDERATNLDDPARRHALRRRGPAPVQRRDPLQGLQATRVSRARGRRRAGRLLRRVGSQCGGRLGDGRLQRLGQAKPRPGRSGSVRDLGGLRARATAGRRLQVPHTIAQPWLQRGQGRPLRHPSRDPAPHGLGGLGPGLRVGRRGVDGAAARAELPRRTHVGLRGPRRLLEAGAGRGEPIPELPGAGRPAGRLRREAGLHTRRAAAFDGAPLLRLVGLPGHGLLRPHESLREPSGPDVPDRQSPSARDRGDPRLGAVALPHRRARVELLRRHRPVRARRPAPGVPAGLEEPGLQLRAPRGPELPAEQRVLLARRLPRGRTARGRRGLDALPGLLPEGGRVDPQRARWSREPAGHRLPAAPTSRPSPRSRHPGPWSRARSISGDSASA